MTTKPDSGHDKEEATARENATTAKEAAAKEQEQEAALEEAEVEEAANGGLRGLYKKIKSQLKSILEYVHQMRDLERTNRKWLEKRLGVLEEELLETRMELKSFKALFKGEKEKNGKKEKH